MEKMFLDFLDRAPRSEKPRARGFQTVSEMGYPIPWLREMLDTYAPYIDCAKFAVSPCWTIPGRMIEEKIKLYRDYHISPAIDDPTFAIAYYQGKADQFLRTVREVGFTHVQIDTHFINTGEKESAKKADEDEMKYIALARELGLKVDGEVGQKWEEGDRSRAKGGLLNVKLIIAEMKRLLAAGCEHIYLEARVIREAIGDYGEKEEGTRQIRQIVEAVGQDNVFIEITGQLPFDTRMSHRFWAVRNFGPDVNMGGGEPIEEVRYIEGLRRGITFAKGPSKSSPMLWVKSLAKNGGKASEEWWKEGYPVDSNIVKA